jgi:hypothetical protein
MARLSCLIGRGRALEVMLGADDIHGDIAEFYGQMNRALPNTELDTFVDRSRRGLPLSTRRPSPTRTVSSILPAYRTTLTSRPNGTRLLRRWGGRAAQTSIKALTVRGFQKAGDVENRLGYYTG